jgi:hypothetical protein
MAGLFDFMTVNCMYLFYNFNAFLFAYLNMHSAYINCNDLFKSIDLALVVLYIYT